jgi:hypothetical protein
MKQRLFIFFTLFGALLSCSAKTPENNMGLFDRLKKETPVPSNEMMDEEQFWSIIEDAKSASKTLEEYVPNMIDELSKLSSTEIIGFYLREQKLRFDSYSSDLWCAAYIMNGGCSDDCFEYFRCWLIAQGKDFFYTSVRTPDSLADHYSKEIEYYEFEDMMYVASDAFEKKTGKEIQDFVDYDEFKTNEAHYPDFEFTWEEDDIESMKAVCPNLMSVAWN